MQSRLRLYFQAVLLIPALLGAGTSAGAQPHQGALRGRVVDPDHVPVPGATIVVDGHAAVAAPFLSDATGAFEVTSLPPGRYIVRAAAPGLTGSRTADIVPGQVLQLDLELRLTAVDETLVVTAVQVDQPLSRVPDSTTVLDGHTLEARQQFTLGQALRSVAGVTVQQSGGPGAVTSLFTRGGESDFTLVLIDGVRANAFGGGIDLSQVPLADVERVEVVRGPQSALYGADAIGGVVHIVTRAAARPSAQGLFEAGGRGMRRGTASAGGARGALRWHAGGDWFAEDGFTGLASNGERVSNDDARTAQGALTLGWRGRTGADAQATVRYVDADRGTPGPYGSDPAGRFFGVDRIARTETRRLSYGARWLQPWFGPGSRVRQRTEFDRADYDLVYASAFPSEGETRRTRVRTQTDVSAPNGLAFSAGAEWLGERGASTYITAGDRGAVPVARSVLGIFGEARWQATTRLTVTAGLRSERIRRDALAGDPGAFTPRPDFPASTTTSVNPKLAAGWLVAGDPSSSRRWTRVHGAVGTGIRPPDAFEIAFTDNPALEPERSRSADIGVLQVLAGGAVQFDLTAFVNHYDDLIISVGRSFAGASRWQTDNISNARSRGAEASAFWRPSAALSLQAAYSFLSTAILAVDGFAGAPPPYAVGDPLLRRPRHQGSVDATWSRGRVGAFAQLMRRGGTLDAEPAFGPTGGLYANPGFTVTNAGASVRVMRGVTVHARVQNLLDARYEEVLGYPAPRRLAYLGCGLLRADNVTFRYHADTPAVVDGITLDIGRGDLVGILGPNGSGKTTLLRLLSGTRQPASGHVTMDGQPIARLSRRDIARRIAVVPQETALAFEYTVLEMVLMGRHPHLGLFEVEGPRDYALARESLAATGTAHLEHRAFHTLSGGEKQRVVIAAGLAQASDVLLLDEPTASLDLGYQLDIATLLTALNRERGVSMAISTHDLNLAASICRTLVLMRDGRLIASGPTADVLTPDAVGALYDVEAAVRVHPDTGYATVVPVRRIRP